MTETSPLDVDRSRPAAPSRLVARLKTPRARARSRPGSTRAAGASARHRRSAMLGAPMSASPPSSSLLGLSHDPPQTLKVAADQAASGARPDLLDRNGEILATDVKTMSVFAEPRRIIDKDEAVELITAVLPDVDAKELRERLDSKKGFVWVKRQVTAEGAAGDLPSRPARRRLLAREQARLSQRPDRRACDRLRRQGQYRHRRHGEISRQAEPDRSACRRLQRRSRQP